MSAPKLTIGMTNKAQPDARHMSINASSITLYNSALTVWLIRLSSTMSGERKAFQTDHMAHSTTTHHALPPIQMLTTGQTIAALTKTHRIMERRRSNHRCFLGGTGYVMSTFIQHTSRHVRP